MTFVTDPKLKAKAPDPIAVAVHLRTKAPTDTVGHFTRTDPKLDLTRIPIVGKLLKKRWLQFVLIVPNQIVFWLVIFTGLLGTVNPGLNFATAITWYIWFCVVFVLMVVVGRAWCSMCPFGGFGEWIQRKTFFKRTQKALGLGLKYPDRLAQLGLISSVATFVLLTYIEEFFNIAGPGTPHDTSFMVIGIVLSATIVFLLFERRTFCRYLCPLSSLIGTVGAVGSFAGFRTKDRDACQACETKSCMRGGDEGFGCPWYTWPGSADSNLYCGLCTECYKACPTNNVGLFVQKPLTSVVAPSRKRMDVAVVAAILLGLVAFQQLNALGFYGPLDNWLNAHTGWPGYPNPIDYFGFIALFAYVPTLVFKAGSKLFSKGTIAKNTGTFMTRRSEFRNWFVAGMYAMIPIVGADYFARQLPKFFKHATRIVPAVAHPFGVSVASLYNFRILQDPRIIAVQVAVMGLGVIGSIYASIRISKRDLVLAKPRSVAPRLYFVATILLMGIALALLYIPMAAAN